MPKFTKQDIMGELRKILLIQADHLVIVGSPKLAEAFIGLPQPEDSWNFVDHDPNLVDVKRFNIAHQFDSCFDYAFTPSVLTAHDDSYVQDLQVFMLGIPRTDNGGDMLPFLREGLCHIVAEATLARFNLDEGFDLTTSQIALMANMTEGAVRNALAQKGEGGLRAILGTKNPVMIEHAEALRWLNERRGFVPTPENLRDDRFLTTQIGNERTAHGLGKLIGRLLRPAFGSPENALEKLGWGKDKLNAWENGTQAFAEADAALLGKALNVDVPLFVGKAREVTLRRDLELAMTEVSA